MKEQWTSPSLRVQRFTPQEYVALCAHTGYEYWAVPTTDVDLDVNGVSFYDNSGSDATKWDPDDKKITDIWGVDKQIPDHYTKTINGTRYLIISSSSVHLGWVVHSGNNDSYFRAWIAHAMQNYQHSTPSQGEEWYEMSYSWYVTTSQPIRITNNVS